MEKDQKNRCSPTVNVCLRNGSEEFEKFKQPEWLPLRSVGQKNATPAPTVEHSFGFELRPRASTPSRDFDTRRFEQRLHDFKRKGVRRIGLFFKKLYDSIAKVSTASVCCHSIFLLFLPEYT